MAARPALVRASAIIAFDRYFRERGLSVGDLWERAGMPLDVGDKPLEFIPLAALTRFFELAAEEFGDDTIGLRAGIELTPGWSGLLGRLVLSAPTVEVAMKKMVAYNSLFMTDSYCGLVVKDGIADILWSLPESVPPPRVQYNLLSAGAMVMRLRLALGPTWRPISVAFDHRPPGNLDALEEVFGPRMRFDEERNCIRLDAAALAHPMPEANAVAHAIFDDLARRLLAEQQSGADIVRQVTGEVSQLFKARNLDLETVARNLGLSARTLQRRLDEAGTTFDQVVSDTRATAARTLILDTDKPMTTIAHDLGYAESSAFTRAVRRWYNKSPKELRRDDRPDPTRQGGGRSN
ncbi:MAG: AraC family transcriptional regulator [Hyphomicrobiaceae bacterium]|nr:AraC family transcriptional regulator [Hyphomicrobiaceae bacterium]